MIAGNGPAPPGKYTSVARRIPSRMATIWVEADMKVLRCESDHDAQAASVVGATIGRRWEKSMKVALAACACAVMLAYCQMAQARITRITITRVESPTFEGRSFAGVGQYEKLV